MLELFFAAYFKKGVSMAPRIDSPYDRYVKTDINPSVRFTAIYVAPSVLLLTAMVYAFGEFKKEISKEQNRDWTLPFGAFLWTIGQLLTLIVLMSNSAGHGFHYNHTKST